MINPPRIIELDCAPGYPRPGDLIAGVVAGTCLEHRPEAQPDAAIARVFGCWMWSFPEVNRGDWETAQQIMEPRIKDLYRKGLIRYGSW